MIVVKIELWPFGNEDLKRDIGRFTIANVGPSKDTDGRGVDSQVCSYKYKIQKAGVAKGKRGLWKQGLIHGFPRKRRNVYDLIHRVLQAVVGERNEGKPK